MIGDARRGGRSACWRRRCSGSARSPRWSGRSPCRGITLGSVPINPLALAGHALTRRRWRSLGVLAAERRERPWRGRTSRPRPRTPRRAEAERRLDAVAAAGWPTWRCSRSSPAWPSWRSRWWPGRLVTRHLGSSIYGWTSVIGVLLGGLSLGNFLGGKIADHVHSEKQASWLFLVASVLTLVDPAAGDAAALHFIDEWLGDRQLDPEPGDHPDQAEPAGRQVDAARLVGPGAPGDGGRLPPAVDRDGDGQPGGRQARRRAGAAERSGPAGDRPGLRLGDGRQHPRHVPRPGSS